MNPVLAYAFGRSRDHALRICGVLRRLARHALIEAHIVSNLPAPALAAEPWLHWYECPENGQIIAPKLRELIGRLSPSLFVVDGYPAGIDGELGGVLPEFPCACVLLQRYLPTRFQLGLNLPEFSAHHYDLCIAPRDELHYPHMGRALVTCPLTYWAPDEILDEVDARLELGYSGRPILLLEGGVPEAERLFEVLLKHCQTVGGLRVEWRLHTLDQRVAERFDDQALTMLSPYRLARAFHMVIAPAGYAHYHECESLGLPTLYHPMDDPHDDQLRRAGTRAVRDPKTLVERLRAGLLPQRHLAMASNGSETAAQAILERIGHRRPGLRSVLFGGIPPVLVATPRTPIPAHAPRA